MDKIRLFIVNFLDKFFPNYFKLANESFNAKQYNKALGYYLKAEKIQKKNPKLYFQWASCWFAVGNYDNAQKLFQKAIELDPLYSEAHCYLGVTLYTVNLFPESIRKFRKAAKLNPKDPKVFLYWGMALESVSDIEKAIIMYNKVIELSVPFSGKSGIDSNRIMATNQLALINLKRNNLNQAAKDFEQLIKLDPTFTPAYYNLAVIYTASGKVPEALVNLKKAVRLDPKAAKKAREENAFGSISSLQEFKEIVR